MVNAMHLQFYKLKSTGFFSRRGFADWVFAKLKNDVNWILSVLWTNERRETLFCTCKYEQIKSTHMGKKHHALVEKPLRDLKMRVVHR